MDSIVGTKFNPPFMEVVRRNGYFLMNIGHWNDLKKECLYKEKIDFEEWLNARGAKKSKYNEQYVWVAKKTK